MQYNSNFRLKALFLDFGVPLFQDYLSFFIRQRCGKGLRTSIIMQ